MYVPVPGTMYVCVGCAMFLEKWARRRGKKERGGRVFLRRVKNENVSCEHVGYHW